MNPARRQIRRLRRNHFAWRWLFNLGPTVSYLTHRGADSDEVIRITDDLERNGLSVSSTNALSLSRELWDELATACAELPIEPDRQGEKAFQVSLLGPTPELDPTSVFARVALSEPIRAVANRYFGMYTQLRFYNVWHTRVASDDAHVSSQLWHRDREDLRILKVFFYLNDVDSGSGPFRLALGTHRGPRAHLAAPSTLEGHVARSTDADLATVVAPRDMVDAVGPPGTVVFADTRAYHCGGFCTRSERLLFTLMYTSRTSEVRDWFSQRPRREELRDAEIRFACGYARQGPSMVLRQARAS